jgi:hypothetical protein
MYVHPDTGRNDHIHGDENYFDAPVLDFYDVVYAIEDGTATGDGTSHHDWIKRICSGDEITVIMQHIVAHRDNPAFAKLMSQIETAVEGWL